MKKAMAGVSLAFVAMWLIGGICATGKEMPRPRRPGKLPVTLTWTNGSCTNCKTARNIQDVQFVSKNEAWAIGFMPPGQAGTGDYSVLHTRDAGKTWTEIQEPWQHNEEPNVSFANATDGWLRDMDIVAAETRLLETHDGGAHWRRLPMRDLFLTNVQYFGGGVGYGLEYDPYSKNGYLIRTFDHGRRWDHSLFPHGFWPERMEFSDRQHGVVAGCRNHGMATLSTGDGGRHWIMTTLEAAHLTREDSGQCDDEPDSLQFLDARHGWLFTSTHVFHPHQDTGTATIWSTADGGISWTPVHRATFRAVYEQFEGLNFLDPQLGFVPLMRWSKEKEVGVLFYTTDGGRHWKHLDQPREIWGCKPFDDSLRCAAGDNGFWVLSIRRQG